MRADIHEGREHMLQSEAGYIDARPHRQDQRNLLHRTAGPYIGSIATFPVPAVMSGSDSSGLGQNCGIDAMGQKQPPALQKRSQEVGPPATCNPFPCDPERDTLPA
jgi:hypothetical protein